MTADLTATIRENPEDDVAWDAWFRKIYPRVLYLVATRSSGNVELAEEATQAALERFLRYRAYEKVTSDSSAIAYLVQTAVRLMIDERRRREREPAWAPEALAEHQDRMLPDWENEDIDALLKRLPEQDQVVLKLVLSGYSVREISGILNLGYSAVGMRIHRAKARLKDIASGT